MAEYIKREATIKAIVDSRNRYYNSASNQYLVGRCEGLDIAAGLLRVAPAADVAPVVRCRECKNWLPGGYKSIADPQNPQCGGRCWYSNVARFENDFCSYGERKDGADNG